MVSTPNFVFKPSQTLNIALALILRFVVVFAAHGVRRAKAELKKMEELAAKERERQEAEARVHAKRLAAMGETPSPEQVSPCILSDAHSKYPKLFRIRYRQGSTRR